MRLVREAAPWLSPRRVLEMATTSAARALDMRGRVGELRPGAAADLLALRLETRDPAAALDELTLGAGEVAGVWVAGRLRFPGLPAVHWAGAQQGSRRGRSPDAHG
jgi:cytosine/adenosine deaminase-related metal-dependent hydrolase